MDLKGAVKIEETLGRAGKIVPASSDMGSEDDRKFVRVVTTNTGGELGFTGLIDDALEQLHEAGFIYDAVHPEFVGPSFVVRQVFGDTSALLEDVHARSLQGRINESFSDRFRR